MKITKVTYHMVRQLRQYEPASFTLEAEVFDGEDPSVAALALQELTIRLLFKDSPQMRDSLLKQLCDPFRAKEPKEDKIQPFETPPQFEASEPFL